jgi:hypothetical protein
LEKQSLSLVKTQLKSQIKISEDNLNEILTITNPTVRRQMLIDFGDQMDAAACDLKAAPIAGQRTRVLLPVKSLKDNECYCPGLDNGTTVALVRFPHAGQWEIPILRVNNQNAEANGFMKDAVDAIGINHHNHGILSGADSDGDTAIVIPMTKKNRLTGEFDKVVEIHNMPPLSGRVWNIDGDYTSIKISDFDPTAAYSTSNPRFAKMVDQNGNPTFKYFKTDDEKGKEMGIISNLITDMQMKGCKDPDELARADMYSMVVIDAKKHKLNYQQAKIDYGIEELHEKYQGRKGGGAATLLSRSKSPKTIEARGKWRESDIDPETGEKIYQGLKIHKTEVKAVKPEYVKIPGKNRYLKDENGEKIIATYDGKVIQNKDGSYSYDKGSGKNKWVYEERTRTEEVPAMSLVKDARQLLSDNPNEIEQAYAAYANHCKAMGNNARKYALATKDVSYSPEAAKKYAQEVKELDAALIKAKKNQPRERQAQLLATSQINAIFKEYGSGELDSNDRRKIRGQCVDNARKMTGAKKDRVVFTEKQVEAINAGAISKTKLESLLRNADKASYVQMFLPKSNRISDEKKALIQQLYKSANWSYEEIA